MSLPTPPGTAHRSDKENQQPTYISGARVAWSSSNQYHNITNSPPAKQAVVTNSVVAPIKSILKKTTHVVLPLPLENEKEVTPEPEDPLVDLTYLESPVLKIVASDTSPRDLTEAYAILAARLRVCVSRKTDADASWPLFQPLRKNRDAFVASLLRDLGRALVDPLAAGDDEELCEPCSMLPSPKGSPKKKGMTAEQVKYARDLCTVCHSVIKFLGVAFTLPAVYRVFTDDQLVAVTEKLVDIPLTPQLPTPNARKTYALSIWLISSLRLPQDVFLCVREPIVRAIQRGIAGALGKEGKKGSVSDGLKAIHDLSLWQPSTFIQPFIELLPNVLSSLVSPSLAVRAQAAHALGGFTFGATAHPSVKLRARIARQVADFLTTPNSPTKTDATSPGDSAIVRTLRTTLNAEDPQHAAQGPVWALTVVLCCIALLGPVLSRNPKVTRIISALLALAMRHRKSSVRAIGCLVWRVIAWAYVQPPFPEGVISGTVGAAEADQETKLDAGAYDTAWKLVKSVVDMGSGVATIAALLCDTSANAAGMASEDRLRKVFEVVRLMIQKGGQTCGDAMEVLRMMVLPSSEHSDWSTKKLLLRPLFSPNAPNGLFNTEWKNLVPSVRTIFDDCPQLDDIPCLPQECIAKDWVFDELISLWKKGVLCAQMPADGETPPEIIEIWDGLLKARIAALQDANDDNATMEFSISASAILTGILLDDNFVLTASDSSSSASSSSQSQPAKSSAELNLGSSGCLKLCLVRHLWAIMRSAFPHSLLTAAGQGILTALLKAEEKLVWSLEEASESAQQIWGELCAEASIVCELDELRVFWERANEHDNRCRKWTTDDRTTIWASFTDAWRADAHGEWEGALVLLDALFPKAAAWDMDDKTFELWESFLQYTLSKAIDNGEDVLNILDHVAGTISRSHITPGFALSPRIVDTLLSQLDIGEASELPMEILEFVNDTLRSTYPPEPRSKIQSCWMLRAVTRIIDTCPATLRVSFLEAIQEGLSAWIGEASAMFTLDEYSFDISPMYQTAILGISLLPHSTDILETLAPLIESAFTGREDKPDSMVQVFREFWELCQNLPEPQEGWPEQIQISLRAAYPFFPTEGGVLLNTTDDLAANGGNSISAGNASSDVACDPLDEQGSANVKSEAMAVPPPFLVPDNSHSIRGIDALRLPRAEAYDPHHLMDLFGSPPRPRSQPDHPITPPRVQKNAVVCSPVTRLHDSASLPKSGPSTPVRVTQASPGSPSSKRRRIITLREKENISPIASVTDHLTKSPPRWTEKFSVLGKRRAAQEWREGAILKRAKATLSSDDDEEWEEVESVKVSCQQSQRSEFGLDVNYDCTEDSSPLSSKKRKRTLIDAVELPTLRDVRVKWKKLRTHLRQHSKEADTVPLRSGGSADHRLPRIPATADGACCYGRVNDVPHDVDNVEELSPTRVLQDLHIVGSDDSIMLHSPSAAPTPSSDDERLDHLIPFSLISPTIHRMQEVEYDPPSDDSLLPTSPSKEAAARRLQKTSLRENSSSRYGRRSLLPALSFGLMK